MGPDPLTSPEHWVRETGEFRPFQVNGHPFADVLERFLPVSSTLSCVEVGAYPGGHLCYLAKRFLYRPTAIEFREDAGNIVTLFEFNGLAAPEIINNDFFAVTDRQFDVVASFGFVEHFTNLTEVIRRHVELMRPGGYLVLSVPHFWGYQGLVRRILLTEEALGELKATHNLKVMNLGVLKRSLLQAGLKIVHASHAMNAHMWLPPDSPKIRPEARMLARFFAAVDRRLGRRLPSCAMYSPMILTISRKP
jgi:2-polyprenyl-3-methyl-5-hydroxy-6-metoxy-1,4-benzoquinol methylase